MKQTISRLSRNLNVNDAVFIGLGSMIGAGIFTSISPAASAAGSGLVIGLIIAAFIAFLNASSSAQLARLYPSSGGTYVYASKRLNNFWGWISGWSFIIGKLASCAAVSLAFGYYIMPSYAKYFAVGAIIIFTLVNYFGIKPTATVTRIIVSIVLSTLLVIVLLSLNSLHFSNLKPFIGTTGIYGILQSAGIIFFAFAGYSRIATIAEEVKDPTKSIPKAILISLAITFVTYAIIILLAVLVVGPPGLSQSNTPLLTTLNTAGYSNWQWVVKIGSTFATLGVLLSLMAGISRTLFAMSADHKLPTYLSQVHPKYKVPYLAEITVGLILIIIVSLIDIRSAIGFSAFTVLFYYAITNAAAITLRPKEILFSKNLAILGFIGCILLDFTLPIESILAGSLIVIIGIIVYYLKYKNI